jgi:hypothetical protein
MPANSRDDCHTNVHIQLRSLQIPHRVQDMTARTLIDYPATLGTLLPILVRLLEVCCIATNFVRKETQESVQPCSQLVA